MDCTMRQTPVHVLLEITSSGYFYTRALNYESITSNHALHSKLVVTGNTIEN